MQYGNLHFLWILWVIPLLVLFFIWAFKRKQQLINLFVEPELKARLLENVSFGRQKFKAFILVLACLFLVLALIRPKWGFRWEEVKRQGVDIMVALDVSKSMLAEDVSPNRLERAKREIIDLLQMMEGDRIGLIAFAGVSFLQSPLTLDYGAVQIFLDDLSCDLIPVPGTAIGQAIKLAMESFDQQDKKSRVLILITDGEDHEGNPLEMAKKAAEQKIKIYTIGIGKEEGAPIPDSEQGGFKKDRNGDLILSKFDEESLQKIALATEGSYVRSITGDMDLEKIYQDIKSSVEEKELASGKRKRFEERFQWPLMIAIILLIFEVLYRERRRSRKSILLLLILIMPNAYAQFLTGPGVKGENYYQQEEYAKALKEFTDGQIQAPNDYNLKYNMANTYYKMKQYPEAEKLFQSTALNGEKELAQKSFYNLGNVAYRQGKLQEAVEHYKKALELNPDDQDAKHNLEFVREEIKRRLEENKKQQENKQCNNPNQQQQQGDKKEQQQGDKKEQQEQQQEKKEQQAESGKEDKKQQKKDEQKQGAAGEKQQKEKQQEMSEQEAERWLSTLDEDRKEMLKKRMKGTGQYRVEKDW